VTTYQHTDVFEGIDLRIDVKLKKGKSGGQQARVLLLKPDGTELASTQAAVSNEWLGSSGSATPTFKLPMVETVDPGMYHYLADVYIEHGGKRYSTNKHYTVWVRDVKVTATDKADPSKKYSGARFRIVQNGQVTSSGVTNKNGEWLAHLAEPEFFTVEAVPPYRAVFEGSQSRPTVNCQVELFWIAQLHKPEVEGGLPGGKTVKQFVNVQTATGMPGHDQFGRIVSIVVGGKGDLERGSADKHAQSSKGHKVFVHVKFENPTSRKRPARRVFVSHTPDDYAFEGLTDEAVTGEDGENKTKEYKGTVAIGGANDAKFFVSLGLGGGEKCTIKVGSTDKCEDDTIVFETWRKMWAQITSFHKDGVHPLPKDKRGMLTDCWNDVFVDFDITSDVAINETDPGVPPGTFVDGKDIHESAGKLVAMGSKGDYGNWKELHSALFTLKAKGNLAVHALICDRTLEYETQRITQLFKISDCAGDTVDKKLEALKKKFQITWPPTGQKVFGIKRQAKGIVAKKKLGRSTFDYNRVSKSTSPIKEIGFLDGATGRFTKADVAAHTHQDDKCDLYVKVPDSVVAALKKGTGTDTTMEVSVDVFSGLSGLSNGQNLTVSQLEDGIVEAMNTIIHEVGHGVGMCATLDRIKGDRADTANFQVEYNKWFRKAKAAREKKEDFNEAAPTDPLVFKAAKDRLPDVKDLHATHGRWHDDARGGQGNHCADGVSDPSYTNLKHDTDTWNGKVHCVIYSGVQSFTPEKWCARCKKILVPMEIFTGQKAVDWGWEAKEIADGSGNTKDPT
jgi:hypothetical protein